MYTPPILPGIEVNKIRKGAAGINAKESLFALVTLSQQRLKCHAESAA